MPGELTAGLAVVVAAATDLAEHASHGCALVFDRSFGHGAAMYILMKDVDLAVAQGEALGIPMWVCQAARLVYKHAMFEGAAYDDISALVRRIESGAGFEMPKTR